MSFIIVGFIVLVIVFAACIKRKDDTVNRMMRGRSIEQVFDSHREELLSLPGVVGVGIAKLDDTPSVIVMVAQRTPELDKQIPKLLDGYPVQIEVTGKYRPWDRQ